MLNKALKKLQDAGQQNEIRDLQIPKTPDANSYVIRTATGLDGVSKYPVQLDQNGHIVFDGRPWQIRGMHVPGAR